MAYLIARSRDGLRKRFKLTTERIVVGRSHSSGAHLDDHSVSKQHVAIETIDEDQRYRVVDLGSKNGVLFRGERVRECELRPGDRFQVGNVLLTLIVDDAETLRIPDAVPRPSPGEQIGTADYAAFGMVEKRRGPRPRRVRWGPIVAVTCVLSAVAGWWGPSYFDRDESARRDHERADDRSASRTNVTVPGLEQRLRDERQTVRIWRLLYGRWPTSSELEAHCELTPEALLDEAEQSAEHWRYRARVALRERGDFQRTGAFQFPDELRSLTVPASLATWRNAVVTTHADRPTPASPRASAAPLPDGDDDEAYRRWFASRCKRSLAWASPDDVLIGLWSLLTGGAPSKAERRCLLDLLTRRVATGDIEWRILHQMVIDALVFRRELTIAPPSAGDEREWCARIVAWLDDSQSWPSDRGHLIDAAALCLRDANVDYRLVLRALLLSCSGLGAAGKSDPFASTPVEAGRDEYADVRIDVLCPFSPRDVLRDPDNIPRLWQKLENALVQTFETDPLTLSEIASRLRDAATASRAGVLAGDVHGGEAYAADGFLFSELRTLFGPPPGEPAALRVPVIDENTWRKLQRSLRLRPTPASVIDATSVVALGAFRFVPASWQFDGLEPQTRALLVAAGLVARGRHRLIVYAPLGDFERYATFESKREAWSELMEGLDRLRDCELEVWLWGPVADGDRRVQAVRLSLGPKIDRGRVVREASPPSAFHSALRQTTGESR